MFRAGRDNIDPCRIDAAMPKNICELSNILFNTVEDAGEQAERIDREVTARKTNNARGAKGNTCVMVRQT